LYEKIKREIIVPEVGGITFLNTLIEQQEIASLSTRGTSPNGTNKRATCRISAGLWSRSKGRFGFRTDKTQPLPDKRRRISQGAYLLVQRGVCN
jgi:hypothetical protein